MSDHITDIENTVHEYRKTLERFADRTGAQTHHIERRGSGEEREKIARIDADLDAVERQAQDRAALRAANDRIAHLEAERAQPQFRAAAPSIGSADGAEYTKRWIRAHLGGNQAELRVLTNGTASAPVPTDMERRIVSTMVQSSVLRQISKVSTINSQRTVRIEATLPTTALVAEEGTISASDSTFASVSVVPYKFVCATTLTNEYIADAIGSDIGNFSTWLADRMAMSMGREMEEYYTIGSGSSQPQGIGDTGSTAWASTNSGRIINQGVQLAEDAGASAITGDNLIDCLHAVPAQYRTGNFKALTSDAAIKAIRKIKVNTTDYVWKINEAAGISGGNPGTILGVPYFINEWVSSAQSASTTANVRGDAFFIFGNFDYFEIFDRSGFEVLTDPYSGAANGRVTMYMSARTDSRIMLPAAFAAIYGLNAS
jgi:HK97 family phage major capsid protein